MAKDLSDNLPLLKRLIVVMTLLIVAGLVALVWGLVRTSKRLSDDAPARAEHVAGENAAFALPAGAVLEQIAPDGRRVWLRLKLASGGWRLVAIDRKSGVALNVIELGADTGAAPSRPAAGRTE